MTMISGTSRRLPLHSWTMDIDLPTTWEISIQGTVVKQLMHYGNGNNESVTIKGSGGRLVVLSRIKDTRAAPRAPTLAKSKARSTSRTRALQKIWERERRKDKELLRGLPLPPR